MAKKGGGGSGGWVSIPEKYRSAFPSDMFEQKSRGGYRISDRYTSPYTGKKFGLTNPYTPLNIKINGSQKTYSQGTFQTRDKLGRSKTTALNFTWMKKHLLRVIEKIEVNSLNYTVILSLRAQKIFQDSFKNKQFYSAGEEKWEALDEKTIKKRKRKHTWPGAGGMLREYGDMFRSIKVRRGRGGKFMGGVYTDKSEYADHAYIGKNGRKYADKRGYKSGVYVYAGLHNQGGRIRGGHRLPKRQFMGHSTYLFDFALQQADRYFFFNVFD